MNDQPHSSQPIVVGVDGSACGTLALQEAVREAEMRNARLRIVCAWHLPAEAFGMPGLDATFLRESAQQIVDQSLQRTGTIGVNVAGEAIEGQPASVLLDEAQGAQLLVVGNRGRGGFTSLMLGSVSQQVVHHAQCPVLVVRGETQT